MEIKSCGLFLECSFVALVLEHYLLANLFTRHPHYDFGAVILIRPYHQMEIVIVEEQSDLSFNKVVLVVHSEQLDFFTCLFFRWIVLLL